MRQQASTKKPGKGILSNLSSGHAFIGVGLFDLFIAFLHVLTGEPSAVVLFTLFGIWLIIMGLEEFSEKNNLDIPFLEGISHKIFVFIFFLCGVGLVAMGFALFVSDPDIESVLLGIWCLILGVGAFVGARRWQLSLLKKEKIPDILERFDGYFFICAGFVWAGACLLFLGTLSLVMVLFRSAPGSAELREALFMVFLGAYFLWRGIRFYRAIYMDEEDSEELPVYEI